MKLWDIMDMNLYRQMLIEKYIRIGKKGNLRILNYTEKAQFENLWNPVTSQCRGLVIDNTWEIIARPFDKFMNYGQNQADIFLKDYAVEVTDKMDGSLGIIFHHNHEWHVATRGSFYSDQAIWATQKYRKMRLADTDIHPWIFDEPNWTYLAEIIYPGNRIVLDYGDIEDLILLGARNIHTGYTRSAEAVTEWRWSKTPAYPFATLSEALAAPPRANAEGYVVYFPDLDYRIKIKQEDYIQLHKIVTGLTKRKVWENMKAGKDLSDLLEIVPDEWHTWLEQTFGDIMAEYNTLMSTIKDQFEDAIYHVHHWYLDDTDIGFRAARKRFAEETAGMEYQGFMFQLLDNKDITEKVWDLVRPAADDVITNSN